MPEIWADKEEVIFEGEVPDSPAQVFELIMGALSENGRAVVRFLVDGDDRFKLVNSDKFEKIEAFSLSHDELTLRLILESIKHMDKTEEQFAAYVGNVLSAPWSQVFTNMNQFIEKVQPFADLFDNLTPYANTYDPPWRGSLEEVSKDQADSLGKPQIFRAGNPALLSDELSINFIPIFKRTRAFREDVTLFAEKVEEEAA